MQPQAIVQPWQVVRVMLFPERRDLIVFYVPDGVRFTLPEAITAPFSKDSVSNAFARAGVEVRVTDAPLGRWTQAAQTLKKAERAEERGRVNQQTAARAALERGGTPLAQSRAEAVARRLAVDEQIRELKEWLARARSAVHTRGVYAAPANYRAKERDLVELKQESQLLQTRMGELRKKEHAEHQAAHVDECVQFRRAAYRLLPRETFETILDAVADDDEEGGEDVDGL